MDRGQIRSTEYPYVRPQKVDRIECKRVEAATSFLMMLSRLLQRGWTPKRGEDELCQKQDVNKFLACLIQLDGRLENFSGRCRRHYLKIEMCTNVKLYAQCIFIVHGKNVKD